MDIGARIAEARNLRGLTQEQLASAVGLQRSALAKIETGSRRITALELVAVATQLQRRIDWFVDPGPQAIISYRNANPGLVVQPIDELLDEIVRDVELVDRYTQFLDVTLPDQQQSLTSSAEAEALAEVVRGWLGVAEDQPVHSLGLLVESLGLLAFSFHLGEGADAGTVLLRKGGVTIVNGDLHVGRRRLALAHELGHYILADPYTTDWRIASDHAEALEARLDRFARALLLPAADLGHRWAAWLENPEEGMRDAAVRAGSFYRVDMSTLARRLLELGLVKDGEANGVRQVKTKKADIVEKNLVSHDELSAVHLPREFERAVLQLYRREMITSSRALGLLRDTFDEGSLPDLPDVSETEIWTITS